MSQQLDHVAGQETPHPLQANWMQWWGALLSGAAIVALLLTLATSKRNVGYFVPVLGIGICIAAAWFDTLYERIPNAITYPAVLLGLLLNGLMALGQPRVLATWLGGPGLAESGAGFGACLLIGAACVAMRGIHLGDLKLIAAMGAIFGLHAACMMLLWAVVIATPFAALNLLLDGKMLAFFRAAGMQLMTWLVLRRRDDVLVVSSRRIPIALPLLGGALLGLLVPPQALPAWLAGG